MTLPASCATGKHLAHVDTVEPDPKTDAFNNRRMLLRCAYCSATKVVSDVEYRRMKNLAPRHFILFSL